MWQPPKALEGALRQATPPRLLVISGEIAQQMLLAERLSQYFYKRGFVIYKNFFDDNHDYWQEQWQSGGLWEGLRFYRLFALRLPDLAFAELFCQQHHKEDLALLLLLPELDRRDQQKKPLALLAKHSLAIATPSLAGQALAHWLREEAAPSLGLRLTPDAAEALAFYYSGAGLAAMQLLKTIALLNPGGLLTKAALNPYLEEQSQFSIYAWLETLLAGQTQESFRIFHRLQQELSAPEILWHFGKLLREVEAIGSGATASQLGIFASKEKLYRQAAKRCPPPRCRQYLRDLLYFDQVGKGQISAIFWEALAHFTVAFTKELN